MKQDCCDPICAHAQKKLGTVESQDKGKGLRVLRDTHFKPQNTNIIPGRRLSTRLFSGSYGSLTERSFVVVRRFKGESDGLAEESLPPLSFRFFAPGTSKGGIASPFFTAACRVAIANGTANACSGNGFELAGSEGGV